MTTLSRKGFKVIAGTTLIKERASKERHRFVQTITNPDTHRRLRMAAAEEDIAIGKLMHNIIVDFLDRRDNSKGGDKK